MFAIIGVLFRLVLRFASVPDTQRFLLQVAAHLAQQTESPIDDQVVKYLQVHLGYAEDAQTKTADMEGSRQSSQENKTEHPPCEACQKERK